MVGERSAMAGHALGIRQHARAAVRGRAQSHDLWPQLNPTVVAVMGNVLQSDMNGHGRSFDKGLG
jgi:hypothetical protein